MHSRKVELMEKYKIEHQQQPDDMSCVMTSAAMLVGLSVEDEEIQKFNRDYLHQMATVSSFAMSRAGAIYVRSPLAEERTFIAGNVYVLHVPSLNNIGGGHSIVVDARDVLELFDPQKGTGKKYYGEGGEKLQAYKMVTEIRNYDVFRYVQESKGAD